MKLIENVHSDAAVLNEHISEFKSSKAFAHVMQVLKDDFVLIPSGGNGKVDAVLKEKDEISFSDMLKEEKMKEMGGQSWNMGSTDPWNMHQEEQEDEISFADLLQQEKEFQQQAAEGKGKQGAVEGKGKSPKKKSS
jgi:hypothetical protein